MPTSITTNELREKYLTFFQEKKHTRIPSFPLVPENDPSVLFTTAGMHPLVPYLKGQPHPDGNRLTDAQKCLRTTDIDEVGDATHATVFEMLGNWSLGDYFKEEAIQWSWEFLTNDNWLGINPQYLAVSVFAGDNDAPRDEESAAIWRRIGVAEDRIAYLDKHENWWPAGGGQPGPQGPDSEIFYWTGTDEPPAVFDPKNDNWVEIWNDVFMQFNLTESGTYEPLPQTNVDTGMGLERVVMILNGFTSIYDIDSFAPLLALIRERMTKPDTKHERILADHIKAATFILGDEHPVEPSNVDRGYVLRRLIRRGVRSAKMLGVGDIPALMDEGMQLIISQYKEPYPSLGQHAHRARDEMKKEIERFESALSRGLKQFAVFIQDKPKGETLSGADAFKLYESYGFPIELTQEMAKEHGLTIDIHEFNDANKKHQDKSRQGSEAKFKGGLADHSEQSVRYHTATHLLHQALRQILGEHVVQKGSNITPERLRFDFAHPTKLSPEELKAVENMVNKKIQEDISVTHNEMTVDQAKEKGALGLFEHKYGNKVSVYSIGDFSVEICGGPHVKQSSELGTFKIKKEESAGAGVRRIKAVLV